MLLGMRQREEVVHGSGASPTSVVVNQSGRSDEHDEEEEEVEENSNPSSMSKLQQLRLLRQGSEGMSSTSSPKDGSGATTSRDETQLLFLAELDRLAPLMAYIAVGPDVMKYSAKLYFSLAIREPKFAHLYIRLLRFLNEQCGARKTSSPSPSPSPSSSSSSSSTCSCWECCSSSPSSSLRCISSANPTSCSRSRDEELTIQSIVLEEALGAIDEHLLPTRTVRSLKEQCERFLLLRASEGVVDLNVFSQKVPPELIDGLQRRRYTMETECLAIADVDEEHERQKHRQKKRGIAILFAELFKAGWVPISLFLGVVRSLVQNVPCLLADPRHRLPLRACSIPANLRPIVRFSRSFSSSLGEEQTVSEDFLENSPPTEESVFTFDIEPSPIHTEHSSAAPSVLSSDIYLTHQVEERLFLVQLGFEMLQLTLRTLCGSALGNGFLAAHSARAKYLLRLSPEIPDGETMELSAHHPCISTQTEPGLRVRTLLEDLISSFEELHS